MPTITDSANSRGMITLVSPMKKGCLEQSNVTGGILRWDSNRYTVQKNITSMSNCINTQQFYQQQQNYVTTTAQITQHHIINTYLIFAMVLGAISMAKITRTLYYSLRLTLPMHMHAFNYLNTTTDFTPSSLRMRSAG